MILAGDIGGTNVRLALFQPKGERLTRKEMEVFPSREYKSLDILIRKFLETHQQRVDAACFGVAGPVRNRRAQLPNLGWVVDGSELADRTGIASVEIINDLEAKGHGIALLGEDDFAVLNKGTREEEGNAGLIAAGTGLGEAGLKWEGDSYWPLAMEGGHADFAPRNALEVDLLYLVSGSDHDAIQPVSEWHLYFSSISGIT